MNEYAVYIIALALLIFGAICYDASQCNAKTEGMRFNHRWSLLGGCQIEVKENQWIPLESYYFKEE